MGKRYKNLYPQIYEFANLFQACKLARKGKRNKIEVCEYEFNLENELIRIQHELKSRTFTFSPYREFLIKEPKERLIHAAPFRDRVVHHAICNIIAPILDRAMIYDSYACRIGKGTHAAIDRAQKFLCNSKWVLKLDIRKYFFTIDHELLLKILNKKLVDEDLELLLKNLLATYNSGEEYYFPFLGDNDIDRMRPRGLPIGNLTSQLFANYFLTPFDRFLKEYLKLSKYLRYMDDCLIFGVDKSYLNEIKVEAQNFLRKFRLKLHDQKSQVFPANNGVNFLGFHIYESRRKILRENLKRFKKHWFNKREMYKGGKIDFDELKFTLNGWLGYAKNKDTITLINKILKQYKFRRDGKSDAQFFFYLPRG